MTINTHRYHCLPEKFTLPFSQSDARMTIFSHHLLLLLLLLPVLVQISPLSVNAASNVHIVYMGERKHRDPSVITDSHHDMLTALLGSKEAATDSMVYSYRHSFSGFAAKITKSQAKLLAGLPDVVSVIPNRIHELQTTRSWDFLHLKPTIPGNLLQESSLGDGVIIGVIDTGIWPESQSFSDTDMAPVPSRWKGICEKGDSFNSSHCNKKIIGARWFIEGRNMENGEKLNTSKTFEYLSPRDANGHGTHVASTAAGSFVNNATFLGHASGLARGGAPRAHVAIYKACWMPRGGCTTADVLAAFDHAINDGVDVISVSIATVPPLYSYVEDGDGIALGSFHAVARGITVVAAGGNSGPFSQTIQNTAPWILTVAASTMDRTFPTAITLGNNQTLLGQAFYHHKIVEEFSSIVYAVDIANETGTASPIGCSRGSLNSTLAKGNIVLCFASDNQMFIEIAALSVQEAGGVGVIFAQHPSSLMSSCGPVACIQVDYEIGTQILFYIHSASSPKVKLSLTNTAVGLGLSPKVAAFSSRGPSSLSSVVLKPDITAPGVNILAAWPTVRSPSALEQTSVNFNIMSGTSMATPHITGIVALIKTLHPDWSPAAIKSAIVTTASTRDEVGKPLMAEGNPRKVADPFDYGGGHVNPNRAADPGLLYDMGISDHIHFLCSMGYSSTDVSYLAEEATSCAKNNISSTLDLNLPSIVIPNLKTTVTISRRVTNVGPVNSIYRALIESPIGVSVLVKPGVLEFNATTNVLTFELTFSSPRMIQGDYSFGSLTWSDGGMHTVRSPIAVRTVILDSYSDS